MTTSRHQKTAPPWTLDDELKPVARWIPHLPLKRRLLPLSRAILHLLPKPNLRGVRIRNVSDGNVRVRLTLPADRKPVGAMLWMHGGGFVLGSPSLEDGQAARFARDLGLAVAAPFYRRAPEHPFPAALDDCRAAWGWLLQRARDWGLDATRIGIGGESAGGGLTACLAQRLRDEGATPPAWQLLVYPMLDDRTANRHDLDALKHPVWDNASNRLGWQLYLDRHASAANPPAHAVAARCTDYRGLAPAWIGVGDADLFWDESHRYAAALQDAGVECALHEAPGAFHGFDVLAPKAALSRAFFAGQAAFLRPRLGG